MKKLLTSAFLMGIMSLAAPNQAFAAKSLACTATCNAKGCNVQGSNVNTPPVAVPPTNGGVSGPAMCKGTGCANITANFPNGKILVFQCPKTITGFPPAL